MRAIGTKRKIQLGAVAIIGNGILALTALSSSPALATSCTSGNFCVLACSSQGAVSQCQAIQPGCTVVSAMCAIQGCNTGLPPPHQFGVLISCTYS